jgi:hypothetical protein
VLTADCSVMVVGADDACPNSDLSPTVVINGCDSGVPNTLLSNGCSISDLVRKALSAGGEDALQDLLESLEDQGVLTEDQAEAIEDCAEDRDDDDKDDRRRRRRR